MHTSPVPLPSSTVDQIAASLRVAILTGALKGKQPLRQDEIAARFGVSKIPVREALFQLKAEGLVTFYPNRGAIVSELSAVEADEIYVMRIALETAALRRAIPRLTVASLTQAAEILNAIDREENIARWDELNLDFHATLYSAAALPHLLDTIKTLHTNIARYLVIYLASLDYQQASQREHRLILEACRHGNIEQAVVCLESHLLSASQQLVAFLNQRELS